jgi:hypothetical protein
MRFLFSAALQVSSMLKFVHAQKLPHLAPKVGMRNGVTISVLSVQLRFQAQTQLHQTYGDRAQNTQNADHAMIVDPVGL